MVDIPDIEVKDHVEKDHTGECGYCGQFFAPEEIVIEKTLHGIKWRFCSEECLRDFKDAADFKDQDLDSEQESEEFLAGEQESDDDADENANENDKEN